MCHEASEPPIQCARGRPAERPFLGVASQTVERQNGGDVALAEVIQGGVEFRATGC